jgi:hypothetical protein
MSQGQIAQFIVPSDAIGNPSGIVLDWAHLRAYLFNNKGLRSYNIALATQSPIASVATAPGGGFQPQGCVDSAGNLIMASQDFPQTPYYKVDPNTLAVTATFGTAQIFGNYPFTMDEITSTFSTNNIACANCNGVDYVLIKAGTFSSSGGMIRTDTMAGAGFYGVISSGIVNGQSIICAGKSGGSQATFFSADIGGGSTVSIGIHKVTVNAGAELWLPGMWPTPNPDIAASLLVTIPIASISGAYTDVTTVGIGYDAHNNQLVCVFQGATGTTNPTIIMAIDPTSGAIIKNTAINPAPSGDLTSYLFQSRMSHGNMVVTGIGATSIYEGLVPSNGNTYSATTVDGLSIQINNGAYSDDVSQLVVLDCSSFSQGGSSPVPVSGTASSFAGWAILSLWPAFPAGGAVPFAHMLPAGMVAESIPGIGPIPLGAAAAIGASARVARLIRDNPVLRRRQMLRRFVTDVDDGDRK